jgi:hypothetical protein
MPKIDKLKITFEYEVNLSNIEVSESVFKGLKEMEKDGCFFNIETDGSDISLMDTLTWLENNAPVSSCSDWGWCIDELQYKNVKISVEDFLKFVFDMFKNKDKEVKVNLDKKSKLKGKATYTMRYWCVGVTLPDGVLAYLQNYNGIEYNPKEVKESGSIINRYGEGVNDFATELCIDLIIDNKNIFFSTVYNLEKTLKDWGFEFIIDD